MDLGKSAVFFALLVFMPVAEPFYSKNPYYQCSEYEYSYKPHLHWGLSCLKNGWSTIPREGRQDSLEFSELQISFSYITRVPLAAFDDFANLMHLILDNNRIRWVQPGAFQKLTKLTQISLIGNQLRRLAPGTLKGLTKLTSLRLTGNRLTVIEDGLFEGAPALESLYLDKNELEFISEDEIAGLPNLRIFHVDKQRSKGKLVLTFKMFSNMVNSAPHKWRDIRVGDNSYDCRCKMAWLINYLHRGELPHRNKVTGLFQDLKNVKCSSTNARDKVFYTEYSRMCCKEIELEIESNGLESCNDLQ